MSEVYKAIAAVMAHMAKEGIGKDRKNSQQGYNFRGIDDVYNALSAVLSANNLVILPYVQNISREERQTKSGGALNYTILTVDFSLVSAKDASVHVVRTIGEAMDSADKSANKAQSAALKYAALQVFMIPTEGDNDPDATTHEVAARRAPVITPEQELMIIDKAREAKADEAQFLKWAGVKAIKDMPAEKFGEAMKLLNRKIPKSEPKKEFAELDDEIPY